MNTSAKILTAVGIVAILAVALAVGGWFVNTAIAQGPWQGGSWIGMHNNQAVLDLLKTSENELLTARQAGKSWLEIGAAKGVSEQPLTDALLKPVTNMHTWMSQTYPQFDPTQMTDWMRQQVTQDLRVTQFGTLTDMYVFGGRMMGSWNGSSFGGMMNGGMMGSWMMNNGNGNNSYGGMMNGGMMGNRNNAPNANATPVPSTQKVDLEVKLTARDFQFDPTRVTVKAGEIVKFTFTNADEFAHNVVSRDSNLTYTVLPPLQTTSILWTAPTQPGTYAVICTWHPGMQFQIAVE